VCHGSYFDLDPKLTKQISEIERTTVANGGGKLLLCMNHQGKDEVVDACRGILSDRLCSDKITVEEVDRRIGSDEIPPVDLAILTADTNRIDGFMLWRMSYAEIFVTEHPWTAFDQSDIRDALQMYSTRRRLRGV
jgi:undecaprenyl diphosphate synthase